MCDPLTIAGIALTLGSTAANYAANQQVQSARNDALAAERIRQRGLDQESLALNTASQDRYTDFTDEQADRGVQLGDYFAQQQVAEPTAGAALPVSTSDIIVKDEAAKRGEAREFTDNSAEALGNLRSFGDLLADTSLGQARDASQIAQIGGFKVGSAGVLPLELDEAGKRGDGLHLLADVLSGLGSAGTTAGLSGGKMPSSTPSPYAAQTVGWGATRPAMGTPPPRLTGLY